MEPGGFSWTHLILSLGIFAFIIWLVGRMFSGGRRVRYTSY